MAKNSPNNSRLKYCVLGVPNMAKSDKSKNVCNGYGIGFDGTGSWEFGNDLAKNIVIFGVDNSSSTHIDDCKNNFLELGE